MLKFIQGKRQQPSADRQKLQKELFAYRKTVQHGFPNKPTCIAWDPELLIMAIGTATGAIKVVGKPGVEFYAHHATCDHVITNIIFIPNEGRLVSLLDDNSLHLWEINDTTMEETKTHTLEGKLKKISAWCLESSKENLLLGTEGGNIYQLNVSTFEMSNNIIYQDLVMQNVPDHYKLNPGAVEAIAEQPGSPNHIIVGYSKGLVVLWDRTTNTANQTYISSQQIESLCWDSEGTKFISSHNDGSFTYWDTSKPSHVTDPTTLYGPFPCKPIHKLLWRISPNPPHEELLNIQWRECLGLRIRTSLPSLFKRLLCSKHMWYLISRVPESSTSLLLPPLVSDNKGAACLVVLAEEELLVIDLAHPDWRTLPLPYLVSLHASAVTFSAVVSDLTPGLWKDLHQAATSVNPPPDTEWPISGGVLLDADGDETNVDETKDHVETRRDILLTGHEDGSVRIWNAGGVTLSPILSFKSSLLLRGDEEEADGEREEAEDEDEWPPFRKVRYFRGHSPVVEMGRERRPRMKMSGPRSERYSVCVYTQHTFFQQAKLRQGHLSTGRSSKWSEERKADHSSRMKIYWMERKHEKKALDNSLPGEATKPVERAIEARGPQDDGLGSMVRCLYLGASYIVSTQHLTPSLWAGTNQGTVYVFTLNIPSSSKRNSDKVICQLAKEIQLKHRAPVIGISIIDASCRPLPEPFVGVRFSPGPHKVIIGSEEQFKVFSLPNLKPVCKLKLTASEGARVRRMSLALFSTRHHSEYCLLCLTNLGDIIVLRFIRKAPLANSEEFNETLIAARIRSQTYYRVDMLRHRPMKLSLALAGVAVAGTAHGLAVFDIVRLVPICVKCTLNPSVVTTSSVRSVIVKQNGVSSGEDEGGNQNTTIQSCMSHDSIGDITIDSVRDHIVNSSSVSEEFRTVTTEVKHQVETTIKHEREVTKTSTVTVSETVVQNNIPASPASSQHNTSVESVSSSASSSSSDSSSSSSSLTPTPAVTEEIRKAPLANSEEFNETLI
ncbi:protein lethal(2) giant larvae [Diaphorina citri]|uniref:Protein lethal(2) giant larvae n=1 Tax=Diaphorina citri TaxID=121845 RepID=A0A3Q0JB51_DIACI|nr:protein lethal(2) giant larvae [Diaphorina citri]